ncbi:MAG: amidase [Dehalococcoidales bacterium]|nr:amidase [Dehalococcoidales bacterium]
MSNGFSENIEYDLKSVSLPKLSGIVLRLLVWLMESPLNGLIQNSLLEKAGISWFRKQQFDELPTFYPTYDPPMHIKEKATPLNDIPLTAKKKTEHGFRFNSITDYARKYQEGVTTPLEVAEKFLEAVADSEKGDKPLRAFIAIDRENVLKQAEESTQRYKQGKPLSILDGVPIPIKDQFSALPYPTTTGTNFMANLPVKEDSAPVAQLRTTGAVIAGKTNMHELGLGVTGINPHHGVTRNPYNPNHHTGGSSSGPATAVAAGFGPAAIGADGGGSIRIPSSFCGLVGLKPTYGRVSLHGDSQLCWSVEFVGPLAATAEDAAIIHAVISGPDENDRSTLNQPPVSFQDLGAVDISDLTFGIYPEYFRHAEPETVSICENLLKKLEENGATIREIAIPNLEAGRVAHTLTIASEISQSLEKYHAAHHQEYGLEVRMNLAMARKFTAHDLLLAQRVRTRMIADYNRILQDVDVIVTPTTGIPAPAIPEKDLPQGISDLTSLFEIMRFATPSNMTGLPSISFPAGYTTSGLPVGMHVTARPWQEKTLLQIALAAESIIEKKQPRIYYDLLGGS